MNKKKAILLPLICVATLLTSASCNKSYKLKENLKPGNQVTGLFTQPTLAKDENATDEFGITITDSDGNAITVKDQKLVFDVTVLLGDLASPTNPGTEGKTYPTISKLTFNENSNLYKPENYQGYTKKFVDAINPTLTQAISDSFVGLTTYDILYEVTTGGEKAQFDATCSTPTLSDKLYNRVSNTFTDFDWQKAGYTLEEPSQTADKLKTKADSALKVAYLGVYLAVVDSITN